MEPLAPATPERVALSSSESSTVEPPAEDLVVLESSPSRPGTSKAVRVGKGTTRLSSFYFRGGVGSGNGAMPVVSKPPSASSDSLPSSPLRSNTGSGTASVGEDLKRMDLSRGVDPAEFGSIVNRFRFSSGSRKRAIDSVESPERGGRKRAADVVVLDSDSDDGLGAGRPAPPPPRRGKLMRGARSLSYARVAGSESPEPPRRKTLARRRPREAAVVAVSDGGSDEESDAGAVGRFERSFERIEPHILELFNGGTVDELVEKTGATVAEARAIVKLRPFDDMDSVETALRRARGVRLAVFNHYRDTVLGHAEVEDVIAQCDDTFRSLKRAMQAAGVQSNESTGAVSIADGVELQQPAMISSKFSLKHYQLEGVEWLNCLRNASACGILADEMGLGKTFQVIAFICRGLEEGRVRGPSLVVCPSSTLDNWMNECAKFAPKLRVVAYSGSQAERQALQEELVDTSQYDVLVTTYNLATGNKMDRIFLKRRGFHAMILDEGHMVKNCMSSRYKWLMQIRTPFRLLLTGTPLQNSLQELVSLLTFIMPKVFAESQPMLTHAFKTKAGAAKQRVSGAESDTAVSSVADSGAQTPQSAAASTPAPAGQVGAVDAQHIEQAKTLLRPFVLRRRKCEVLSDLPSKTENIVKVELTPTQRELYDSVVPETANEDIRRKLKELDSSQIDAGEGKKGEGKKGAKVGSSWIGSFMDMRKAADHPLLLRSRYAGPRLKQIAKALLREPDYADANYDYVLEDMEVCSDFELHELCATYPKLHRFKLADEAILDSGKVQQLRGIVDACVERGEKLLLFSQFTSMLTVLEAVFAIWGVGYFRLDGQTKVDERQGMIDRFNSDDSKVPVFLLSTKAGGFGINLTSANVVVIYDAGNNPSEERQAEDRAHRVGQTKDVRVYRLVGSGTIDEDILESSRSKQLVEQMFWMVPQ
ncbi:DNA-dependent ATPase fun30 [Coemansia sp. RSA 552]|nr:DNA-dependent ATPase fun30 [Coemansia sp. RSA 552]